MKKLDDFSNLHTQLSGLKKPDLIQELSLNRILLTLGTQISLAKNLDEVLENCLEVMTRAINCDRATAFLSDEKTQELYSRVALGNLRHEIRFFNNVGVAGHVFQNRKAEIISDTARCAYFNKDIDTKTGYNTRNIICVPLFNEKNKIVGIIQCLNKIHGDFTPYDLDLLERLSNYAAPAIERAVTTDELLSEQKKEQLFQQTIVNISSEINLSILLNKVMKEVTTMLSAERSTLFLNDTKTNELFSELGQGLDKFQIRIPNDKGIAGAVFQSGTTINIPYAYADMRFDPSMDQKTGYFTRNILCSPIINKKGERIGVTQVLNKKGGIFTHADEARLAGFTSQISIALENAKLFDDIQNIKNYNEIMLESMSNGVITADENSIIQTSNLAALALLQSNVDTLKGKPLSDVFSNENVWVLQVLEQTQQSHKSNFMMDQPLNIHDQLLSVNLTTYPLINSKNINMGSMLMFEDISKEKRLRTTMSRYMNPTLATQLIDSGELVLGGKSGVGTVLFSDIRSFTLLSEQLGPEGTVNLLNSYFTLMVDCINEEDGMLDKFIGDAIMALFGVPIKHDDDPDRAVRCAIQMIKTLQAFNHDREKQQLLPVHIGIGINTDQIVTGNIGSPKRMEFTAVGDGVNLASRLESACKQYGTQILVTEYTMNALKGTYRNRKIDQVIFKGKTEPVFIYEILDFHTAETFPNMMETLNYFQSGLELYTIGKWIEAIKMFQASSDLNPHDQLCHLYLERCRFLQENQPDDWQGIWVMTEK